MRQAINLFLAISMLVLLDSCKKENVYPNNPIPPNAEVSTLTVEQYVNRCFIDVLGRAATETELSGFVGLLESDNFSVETRRAFIQELQSDTLYQADYLNKVYVDMKARYLDGLNNDEIQQEANFWFSQAQQAFTLGDALAYELTLLEYQKIMGIRNMAVNWESNPLDYAVSAKAMMFNSIYDDLNMGVFNFIHAAFDQNFYRYPTDQEYEQLYAAVEYSGPGMLFQQNVSSKSEMLDVLVESTEFKEGLVRWFYRTYYIREPDTNELVSGIAYWSASNDFNAFLQQILSNDEYAGLNP